MSGFVWGDPSTYALVCARCGVELEPPPRALRSILAGGPEVCRRCWLDSAVELGAERQRHYKPWQPAYWRWRAQVRSWKAARFRERRYPPG